MHAHSLSLSLSFPTTATLCHIYRPFCQILSCSHDILHLAVSDTQVKSKTTKTALQANHDQPSNDTQLMHCIVSRHFTSFFSRQKSIFKSIHHTYIHTCQWLAGYTGCSSTSFLRVIFRATTNCIKKIKNSYLSHKNSEQLFPSFFPSTQPYSHTDTKKNDEAFIKGRNVYNRRNHLINHLR